MQTLYRSKTDLREKESSLKDHMAEKKATREGLKEERKEALARKDAIEKGWSAYSAFRVAGIHWNVLGYLRGQAFSARDLYQIFHIPLQYCKQFIQTQWLDFYAHKSQTHYDC